MSPKEVLENSSASSKEVLENSNASPGEILEKNGESEFEGSGDESKVPESIRSDALKVLLGALLDAAQNVRGRVFRVIEIGTARGFSSIAMAEALAEAGIKYEVMSAEKNSERALAARDQIRERELSENIEVINADAAELLRDLPDDAFDFAFLDGPKGQYSKHFKELRCIVRAGGTIVTDNVNFDEKHDSKRYKTIYKRMNLFRSELDSIGATVDMDTGLSIYINKK